jgi:hypothetical protein
LGILEIFLFQYLDYLQQFQLKEHSISELR